MATKINLIRLLGIEIHEEIINKIKSQGSSVFIQAKGTNLTSEKEYRPLVKFTVLVLKKQL